LAEIFLRDASKALAALEAIHEKRGAYGDKDIRTFTIHAHAMKSALANIGEPGLSAAALRLEEAGQGADTALMAAETPAFLRGLAGLIEKLATTEP
jgi:HPt (histidine-containing phosphotransfer) domain-containing protein